MTDIDKFVDKLEKKVGGIFIGIINGQKFDREKAKRTITKDVTALCESYSKSKKSPWVFDLNEVETKRLEKWQKKIKKKHGKYGSFTFKFTPTGVGPGISVYNNLEDKEKNITDYDSW